MIKNRIQNAEYRRKPRDARRCGMTLIEIIISLAIITIILVVIVPQFAMMRSGWASKEAATEALQNGRILMDHIERNLSKAVKITDVSSSSTTNGYILFLANDGNSYRYDINSTNNYVEYGAPGNLSNLAGPVSNLQFSCYDACMSSPIDTNSIRFVKAATTLVNSVSSSRNKTLIASVYLRTNGNSTGNSTSVVGIIGDGWQTGTTHTRQSGTNRALLFIAHAENSSSSVALTSVTYGGQSMTKVIEKDVNSGGYCAHVVAYILNEAGIAAATSSTFSPTWNTTPYDVAYPSVFLQNVNQTTLTGASDSNGITSSTKITTKALATSSGDMVIDAATCGNVDSGNAYTVNNGFTEALEPHMSSSCGVDGYKSATGANETPSVTYTGASGVNRQVLIGFVVNGIIYP